MKKLLLLLMCVLTAVGVRAEKTYFGTDDGSWYEIEDGVCTVYLNAVGDMSDITAGSQPWAGTDVTTLAVTMSSSYDIAAANTSGEWDKLMQGVQDKDLVDFSSLNATQATALQSNIPTEWGFASGYILPPSSSVDDFSSLITSTSPKTLSLYRSADNGMTLDVATASNSNIDLINYREYTDDAITSLNVTGYGNGIGTNIISQINSFDGLKNLSLSGTVYASETNITLDNDDLVTLDISGLEPTTDNTSMDVSGCDALTTIVAKGMDEHFDALTVGESVTAIYVDDKTNPGFTVSPTTATALLKSGASTNYADASYHLVNNNTTEIGDQIRWEWGGNSKKIATLEVTPGSLQQAVTEMLNSGNSFSRVYIKGALNASDMAALSQIQADALIMDEVTLIETSTTSSILSQVVNPYVHELVLPAGSKRDNSASAPGIVNATTLAGFTSLYSAVSREVVSSTNYSVTAYVKEEGSLKSTVQLLNSEVTNSEHTTELGWGYRRTVDDVTFIDTGNAYTQYVKEIVISGHVNAYDLAGEAKLKDGHVSYSTEPTEQTRGVQEGATTYGAFNGMGSLVTLDLRDAEFSHINDFTLGKLGCISQTTTKYITIPQMASVTEIPREFLLCANGSYNGVAEICIPSNIQKIGTYAFNHLFHIWTTAAEGDIAGTMYDNGVYDYNNDDTLYGYTEVNIDLKAASDSRQPRYGTSFTFSSNLKLIESYAFFDSNANVKDVYVLSEEAPECHVDAFTNQMYFGINGFTNEVVDGIIARESYVNSGKWITMLHYPRNTTTPNIQRYTDPTRKYSIASTLIDSRGNNVNLPTQSEFNAAFKQGTTGYLWGAWDPTLEWGMMRNGINKILLVWSEADQKAANDYVSGKVVGEAGWANRANIANNPDVSFYDLTQDGQNGASAPTNVTPYYNVIWEGKQLYPAPGMEYIYDLASNGEYYYNMATGEYEQWTAAAGEVPRYNRRVGQVPTGEYTTECDDAKYVRDENYVENAAGKFVRTMTLVPNGSKYVQDYEWQAADYDAAYTGTYYYIDEGYQYESAPWGQENDYYQAVYGYTAIDAWENGCYKLGDDNNYYQSYHAGDVGSDGKFYKREIVGYQKYDGNSSNWPTYKYYNNGYKVVSDPSTATVQLYIKNYLGTYREATSADAADEPRYDITWGEYATYVEGTNYGTYGTNYMRYNIEYSYRLFDASKDAADATRYCPLYETRELQQVKQNDYRGWHQFVLTGYADPTTDIIINHRSYITDNDWWTICLPYDLNYKEMMLFYGDPQTGKIPYLALLTNVVRDLGEQTITLNFSENLMTHKAYRTNGVWTVTNEAPSTDARAGEGQNVNTVGNDIVLHAGVPYLIRPNRIAQAGSSFSTQFDIYGQENVNQSLSEGRVTATNVDYPLLYRKMETANELGSYDAMALVEKGIYTVPALVKNNNARAEGVAAESTGSGTLDVKINSITENLPISADWDYSFVGNLYYNSFLPQNSYFLGWYEKARFFYADYTLSAVTNVNDKNYKFVNVRLWNNNTCIICPNMMKSSKYHASEGAETANSETQTYMLGKGNYYGLITPGKKASQGTQPAQWLIGRAHGSAGTGDGALANDWFAGGSAPQHAAAANPVLMDFGITNMAELTGIEEVKTETKTIPAINDNKVYTIDGRYVGNSIEGLGKGLYILNGKKVVVK